MNTNNRGTVKTKYKISFKINFWSTLFLAATALGIIYYLFTLVGFQFKNLIILVIGIILNLFGLLLVYLLTRGWGAKSFNWNIWPFFGLYPFVKGSEVNLVRRILLFLYIFIAFMAGFFMIVIATKGTL